MSTPEPRFEVPPEYAEVYERAYRRAYEEVQASLGDGAGEGGGPVLDAQGRVVSIPRQRTLRRPPMGSGHRADRRSARALLLGFTALLALILLGAFVVGRLSADSPVASARSAVPSATPSPVPAKVGTATTTCTALSSGDTPDRLDFDVNNVLDSRASTAWACDGVAVGQVLTFPLAAGTRLVQVGIVPGWASGEPGGSDDRYATGNRITRVAWQLGNGNSVQQALKADPTDRSLRVLPIAPVTTNVLRLKILSIARGERNRTAISSVQILAAP